MFSSSRITESISSNHPSLSQNPFSWYKCFFFFFFKSSSHCGQRMKSELKWVFDSRWSTLSASLCGSQASFSLKIIKKNLWFQHLKYGDVLVSVTVNWICLGCGHLKTSWVLGKNVIWHFMDQTTNWLLLFFQHFKQVWCCAPHQESDF